MALKNEIAVLKDLEHKHIVKFYDAISRTDGLYLFLEYMPKVYLTKNIFTLFQILKIIFFI